MQWKEGSIERESYATSFIGTSNRRPPTKETLRTFGGPSLRTREERGMPGQLSANLGRVLVRSDGLLNA